MTRASPFHRLAVYWAPEASHPLWRSGCDWLGRDPGAAAATPTVPTTPLREATAMPRRYGFHATVKAPIRLREGASEASFFDAVQALAAQTPRFAMPPLSVRFHDDYLALCPQDPVAPGHPLRQLADRCVRSLDPWRAPLTADDLKRREAARLSDAERAALHQWGYPHALELWRFHMTLSDALPDDAAHAAQRERLHAQARQHFDAALQAPLRCESLAVFAEPAPGAPFVLVERFPLAA